MTFCDLCSFVFITACVFSRDIWFVGVPTISSKYFTLAHTKQISFSANKDAGSFPFYGHPSTTNKFENVSLFRFSTNDNELYKYLDSQAREGTLYIKRIDKCLCSNKTSSTIISSRHSVTTPYFPVSQRLQWKFFYTDKMYSFQWNFSYAHKSSVAINKPGFFSAAVRPRWGSKKLPLYYLNAIHN